MECTVHMTHGRNPFAERVISPYSFPMCFLLLHWIAVEGNASLMHPNLNTKWSEVLWIEEEGSSKNWVSAADCQRPGHPLVIVVYGWAASLNAEKRTLKPHNGNVRMEKRGIVRAHTRGNIIHACARLNEKKLKWMLRIVPTFLFSFSLSQSHHHGGTVF